MKLKQLITDDDAVSPVIGVILMVAITVILAAVIGTFVLGIGQDQSSAPNVSFDFNSNATNVTVKHAGGDQINPSNTGASGSECSSGNSGLTVTDSTGGNGNATCWQATSADPITASDTVVIGSTSGETVEVIWEADGGGDSQILADYDVP